MSYFSSIINRHFMVVDSPDDLYCLDFLGLDQIQSIHRGMVGEQAFYLSLLMQRGYPVAPGFVISSTALHRFLGTVDWSEPMFRDLPHSSLHLDVENPRQLQTVAQKIQQAIALTPLDPDWLAELVKRVNALEAEALIWQPSIALHADTDISLGDRVQGLLMPQVGRTDSAAIAQSIRQVWGELFRARSLFYWQRSRIPLHQVQLALVVQPLQRAIASGDLRICQDHLKIRSVHGLIQPLNRGEVIPDVQEIDLKSGEVLTQEQGSKEYTYQLAIASTPNMLPAVASAPWAITPTPLAQQQQFALQEKERQQLTVWAQRLATEIGHHLQVEWTIARGPTDASPTLAFTQVWVQRAIAPTSVNSFAHHDSSSGCDCSAGEKRPLTGKAAAPGRVFAPVWLVPPDATSVMEMIPSNVVIVAPFISPEWITQLSHVAGFIAEQGGMTSHAAILARELGIPAVVGVAGAMQHLQSGEVVCLDGDRGVIYTVSHEAVLHEDKHEDKSADEVALPVMFVNPQGLADSLDCKRLQGNTQGSLEVANATQLMVNLGRTANFDTLQRLPIDGVGLLRSEHLLMDVLRVVSSPHKLDWQALTQEICEYVRSIAAQFAPRPVFYRTLDFRSHEFRGLQGESAIQAEANPLLGLHGVFRDRLYPQLFEAQLVALRQLQTEGLTNLRLLLPFVRSVDEFRFCRDRLQHFGLDQTPGFEVWIMAEVPSVLFLLPDFVAAGVQGISIGTNDLTQLLLAIDRDHPQMAGAYDEAHPAVLRAIHHLSSAAKQMGIPCSICGEAPVIHPEIIPDLVRWGIASISVSPEAVERTYRAIAQSERALILEAARKVIGN